MESKEIYLWQGAEGDCNLKLNREQNAEIWRESPLRKKHYFISSSWCTGTIFVHVNVLSSYCSKLWSKNRNHLRA